MNKYYCQYIQEMNIHTLKSQSVRLYSGLKTTKLMTRLKHRLNNDTIDTRCENPIDVLYLKLTHKNYVLGKLVVIYVPSDVRQIIHPTFSFNNRVFTFTQLKTKTTYYWLQKCETEDHTKIVLSDDTTLRLWDTPLLLEAVTDYDKDFRKEWEDGWLAYEGNEYGDTSTFYVIGCIK